MVSFPDHKIRQRIIRDLTATEKKSYHFHVLTLLEKYYGFKHSRHFLEYLYHATLAEDQSKINQYSAGIGVFFFNRGMYEEGQQYFGNAIANADEGSTFLLVEYYFWKAECELSLFRLREAYSDFIMAIKHLEKMNPDGTEKQRIRIMKIQLVITHKLMLIEYHRHRVGEAKKLQIQAKTLHKKLQPNSKNLTIGKTFSMAQQNWDEFSFPLKCHGNDAFDVLLAVFGTLIQMDHTGSFIPNLASQWNWDAKTRTLRFILKKNQHYHNGALIRSEDVLFSLDVIKKQSFYHMELSSPARRIKNYKINDAGEIEITYYAGPPPNLLFWCRLFILPSYLFNHQVPSGDVNIKNASIGSGPFEVSQISTKGWALRKSDKSMAAFPQIQFFHNYPSTLKHLLKGRFHLAQLDYSDWKQIIPNLQVNYSVIRDQIVENKVFRLCFKLNQTKSFPLSLRRALYLSLPLENWNTLYLDNQFVVSRFDILRTQATEGQSKIRKIGSTEVFRALTEMGAKRGSDGIWLLQDQPVLIRLLLPKDPKLQRVFKAIVKSWRTMGLKIQISWRDYHAFGTYISNPKVDAWIDFIKLDPSYEGLADYLHHDSISHGGNSTGYASNDMNYLLNALQNSPIRRRKNLILRIKELFEKELPWLPLYQPKIFYAYNTGLGAFQPSDHGLFFSPWQYEHLHPLN